MANIGLPIANQLPIPLGQCPLNDDPTHPIVLPYPNDCSAYYVCSKGLAYPKQCPPNLYWSQTNYRCDILEYSNCISELPVIPDYKIQYSPYPGDCTRYYETRVHQCPLNNQWNPNLQRCELSQFGGCNDNHLPWIPRDPITITEIIPTAATPLPWLGQSDNYLPIDPIAICRANNQKTYLPYPNDCHKFIFCGPQPAVIKCSGQLYWNALTQSCDISSAGCYSIQ